MIKQLASGQVEDPTPELEPTPEMRFDDLRRELDDPKADIRDDIEARRKEAHVTNYMNFKRRAAALKIGNVKAVEAASNQVALANGLDPEYETVVAPPPQVPGSPVDPADAMPPQALFTPELSQAVADHSELPTSTTFAIQDAGGRAHMRDLETGKKIATTGRRAVVVSSSRRCSRCQAARKSVRTSRRSRRLTSRIPTTHSPLRC